MHWSWSSFATVVLINMVLFQPRATSHRLKVVLAVVCMLIGEGILLSGVHGLLLSNALMFLAASLLFLGEVATSRMNPLIPAVWIGVGLIGVGLMLWRQNKLITWVDTTRPWLVAGCAAAGALFGAMALYGHRRSITVRYDPHDLSGF